MIMAATATTPSPTRLLPLASPRFASPSSPLSPRSRSLVKDDLLAAAGSMASGGDVAALRSPPPPPPLAGPSVLKRKRPPRLTIPALERESSAAVEDGGEEYSDYTMGGHGFGVACKKGRRQAMEDTFAALPTQGFFGVFDGHGGRAAAKFAARNLFSNIVKASRPDGAADDTGGGDADQIQAQIGAQEVRMGYHTTDYDFLRQGSSAGASCVSAMIARNELIVANAGDCRALLVKSCGSAVQLTQDHRFSSESERRRVENLGGVVDRYTGTWRVQGVLAVSRGIGDMHLKQFISCDPHVVTLPLTPGCDFLVLASDGLWDLVSNQEVADCVLRALGQGIHQQHQQRRLVQVPGQRDSGSSPSSGPSNLGGACRQLVDLSLKRGCLDDVTVMIVELGKFYTS